MSDLAHQSRTSGSFVRVFSVLLFLGALCCSLFAQPTGRYVVLSWDSSGDSTVVGTFLYYWALPEGTPSKVDVGANNTYTVDQLTEGVTYAFYVTAYNAERLESEPSETIHFTPLATSEDVPLSSVLSVLEGPATVGDFAVTMNELGTLNPPNGPPPLEYQPPLDFSGKAVFTYALQEQGGEPTRGWVSVLVAPVDDPPQVPSQVSQTVEPGVPFTLTVPIVDPDTSIDLFGSVIASDPLYGTLSEVAYPVHSTFQLVYETTLTSSHPGRDEFLVMTTLNTEPQEVFLTTVVLTIAVPNSAPTALGQSVSVEAGSTVGIVLRGTDPEGAALTYAVATGPQHGTLSGTPPNVNYTASAGYSGSDSFTFTVRDGELTSSPATVAIQVTAGNAAPTATAQTIEVLSGDTITIRLSGEDPDNDSLTYELVSLPQHGTLKSSPPRMNYVADSGYDGTDSFQFVVRDALHTSQPAEVSIIIHGTSSGNLAPSVDAGMDMVVTMPGSAQARGKVQDDGLPGLYPNPLTAWEQVEGPSGGASIQNTDRTNTKIRFQEPGTYVFKLAADDGELSAEDELVVQVGTLSAALPHQEIVSLAIEAESGSLARPMSASTDPLQTGITYVSSSRDRAGRAAYSFGIPTEGDYIVWCRVRTPSAESDSFTVYVDGDESTRDVYDASEGEFGDSWKWTALCGRGGADRSEDYAYTISPRVFHFASGQHTLTFEGAEKGTQLDRFLVTNDPEFDPVLAEQFPVVGGTAVINSTGMSLEWSAIPGRTYQVAVKESLLEPEWVLLPELITATTTRVQYDVPSASASRFHTIVLLP